MHGTIFLENRLNFKNGFKPFYKTEQSEKDVFGIRERCPKESCYVF